MFTGIVEKTAQVISVSKTHSKNIQFSVKTSFPHLKLGESISVNGVCLTVLRKKPLTFEIGKETQNRTTFQWIKKGTSVHLERAMHIEDRLSGHLVLGHVDGVANITRLKNLQEGLELTCAFPKQWTSYLLPQGSIALDGVSLTIYEIKKSLKSTQTSFFLLPYTLQKTRFASLNKNDKVNFEIDYIGKWIQSLCQPYKKR